MYSSIPSSYGGWRLSCHYTRTNFLNLSLFHSVNDSYTVAAKSFQRDYASLYAAV